MESREKGGFKFGFFRGLKRKTREGFPRLGATSLPSQKLSCGEGSHSSRPTQRGKGRGPLCTPLPPLWGFLKCMIYDSEDFPKGCDHVIRETQYLLGIWNQLDVGRL